ncbi:MAG: pirin family protein, partial [Thiohalocapsa sp.]
MIEKRPFASLGGADEGWLNTRHHFSFAGYRDPQRMHWGALRVWNDDEIAPGTGFAPHPHANMEIITYVRQGAVTHRDSLGNEGRTAAGDVQVMSAGSGIRHSEYNLEAETTQLFQIWIVPERSGGEPNWGAKQFPKADRAAQFVVLASGTGGDPEALPIRADARVVGATLNAGQIAQYRLAAGRHAYLVPASGAVEVNGVRIDARGGAPTWGAKPFPKSDRAGRFVILASGQAGDDDALPIRTDARVLGATLKAGETAQYPLTPERHAYVVPASGAVEVNGV